MKLSLKLPARFAPRKPRVSVAIEATLLLPNDAAVPIVIKNISPDGFMGEVAIDLACDARIGVALAGCGIVPARVRWSDDGEIGAQFNRPLDLDRLEQAAPTQALFQSRVVRGPL